MIIITFSNIFTIVQEYYEYKDDPVFTLFMKLIWASMELLLYDSAAPEVVMISSMFDDLMPWLIARQPEIAHFSYFLRLIKNYFKPKLTETIIEARTSIRQTLNREDLSTKQRIDFILDVLSKL